MRLSIDRSSLLPRNLIFLIISIASFSACVSAPVDENINETAMLIDAENTSVSIPIGWTAEFRKAPLNFVLYAPVAVDARINPNASVISEQLTEVYSLEEYKNRGLNYLAKISPNIKVLESKDNYHIFSGLKNDLKQIQYFYKQEQSFYVVTCSSTTENFATYLANFKSIGETFTINPATNRLGNLMQVSTADMSIEVPRGWQVQYTKTPMSLLIYAPVGHSKVLEAAGSLRVENLRRNYSLKKYKRKIITKLRRAKRDLSLVESKENYHIFSGLREGSQQVQYFFKDGKVFYTITFTTTMKDFPTYLPSFEAIIKTFKYKVKNFAL